LDALEDPWPVPALDGAELAYWAALAMTRTVFRIDEHLFVMQGWNHETEMLQIGAYCHVVHLPRGPNEYGIACTCARWKAVNTCIHQRVVAANIPFLMTRPLHCPIPPPPAVLLHTTIFHDLYIFSCISSIGRYESGKRTIVTFQRTGRWHCQSSFATEAGLATTIPSSRLDDDNHEDEEGLLMIRAAERDDGLGSRGYCVLPAPIQRAAVLYTPTERIDSVIEVTPCPYCRHARRQIGPDLGEHGVFNWNNTMLFSHSLLNAFTNVYTASETPFSAFCLTISRTYVENGFEMIFCSDETFVRVWFAYVRLQELDSGMACPTCGPSPRIVIADGVSLGTHSSKLTGNVHPPTIVNSQSENIESISSYKARSLPTIPEPDIRSTVLKVLEAVTTAGEMPNTVRLYHLYPVLYASLALFLRDGTQSPHYHMYRSLFQQIAAPDIVLQLIPFDAIEPLQMIARREAMPDWLQSLSPAVGSYSKLRYDARPLERDAEEMGDCNKFYKTYSKNNLTGGILVL
ncbi:hypothetical protein B0H21DRAFT_657713, partial [Amylocystis lapponica]